MSGERRHLIILHLIVLAAVLAGLYVAFSVMLDRLAHAFA
jgi:hypothetical protein